MPHPRKTVEFSVSYLRDVNDEWVAEIEEYIPGWDDLPDYTMLQATLPEHCSRVDSMASWSIVDDED